MPNIKLKQVLASLNHKTKTLVSLTAGRSVVALHNPHLSAERPKTASKTQLPQHFLLPSRIWNSKRTGTQRALCEWRKPAYAARQVPTASGDPVLRSPWARVTRAAQDQGRIRDSSINSPLAPVLEDLMEVSCTAAVANRQSLLVCK